MITTAIHFNGNCDEAIEFYKKIFNAEVLDIAYFKDAPSDSGMEKNSLPPKFVMHSEISILGTTFNLTDGADESPASGNYSFLITLSSDDEVTNLFGKLSNNGKVIEPLAPAFWSSMYGMVQDEFGITWQLMTEV